MAARGERAARHADQELLGGMLWVDVTNLERNPGNRTVDTGARFEELKESIRQHGVIEPLVVRWMGDDAKPQFQIIAGERRWLAAQAVGLTQLLCRVFRDVDDRQALQWVLIDNLHREDLDPIEEAEGYAKLREMGMAVEEIADRVNRDRSTVSHSMRLLELPENVLGMVRSGELSASHGKALVGFAGRPKVLDVIVEDVIGAKLSAKQVESYLDGRVWMLADRKVVRRWDYDGPFPERGCEECADHRKLDMCQKGLCLNPACFDAKKKEAAKERKEKLAGQDVLKLDSLKEGEYERLDHGAPEDCKEDCEHRKSAQRGDERIAVCLDPKCHKRLTETMRRSAEEARREELRPLIEQARALLDSGGADVWCAAEAVSGCMQAAHPNVLQAVIERLRLPIDVEKLHCGDWLHQHDRERRVELGKLHPLVILRFAAEWRMTADAEDLAGHAYRKHGLVHELLGIEEEPSAV